MSPDLRVLGAVDGLPMLPDTEYLLCCDPEGKNELAQIIYQAMESYQNPGNTAMLPLKVETIRF